MPVLALTDRFVSHAKPGPEYFDDAVKGLALRVSAGGHKAWTFHFTTGGKRARVTLGSYPATGLAKARTLATEARGHVEEGRDPRRVLKAADAAAQMTVGDLIGSYLEKHVRPNLRSAHHMELRLAANVTPVIGDVRLADLHRRDINRVLDPIMARRRPTQARLVFQDLRAMLRWAVARGDLDRSPMEGLDRPSSETPRERVLSDDEIRQLWNGLDAALAKSPSCQRIVKLCLVTAQRVGEVSGMRRDELDLDAATWSLPGLRTKNGYPHLVPLSPLARDLVNEALADAAGSEFVFPCGNGSLAPTAVARTIVRAHQPTAPHPHGRFGVAHFTAHDLRRTALTGMARLGVSPTVLGFVANHRTVTRGGVTMGVYVHYSHDREKREALELWAERVEALVGSAVADVVPLNRREA